MKKKENYLDFIPAKNPEFIWEKNEKGVVVVTTTRKGFFDKIAQKFFQAPRQSKVKLDIYGTFVWELIDGKISILEIGKQVEDRFGQEAEPLYPRLVEYFQILRDHKFIKYSTS